MLRQIINDFSVLNPENATPKECYQGESNFWALAKGLKSNSKSFPVLRDYLAIAEPLSLVKQ